MPSSCVAWCEYEDFELPADVLAGQGAPPDPGLPLLPPLPIAAIPLRDGMAAPLAAFVAVPVGLFGYGFRFLVCVPQIMRR